MGESNVAIVTADAKTRVHADRPPRVWLRPNPRLLLLLGASAVVLFGAAVGLWAWGQPWWMWGLALAIGAVIALWALVLWIPRLKYNDAAGALEVHVAYPQRYASVPIGLVECFLLHTTPSMLPGRWRRTPTVSIVIRLDERAEEFAQRDSNRQLCTWCGSQVSIVGTLCEPIDVILAQRLNRYLTQARRASETHAVSSVAKGKDSP